MVNPPRGGDGRASRPSDEGNNNFLVWQLPAVNCSVDARGRGFVPINLADTDRNEFRFPSILILDSQLLTLKNDAHPVE
jgi:hypothetical protein